MIFFSIEPFVAGSTLTLGDGAARHGRALRLGVGDAVELRDGRGNCARGQLARVAKRSLTVDVEATWQLPALLPVHLLVPVADRDRMMMLAEKSVELTATSWRPVMWRRSRSVGPAGDGPAFQARLKARMVAALMQCGGGWLPAMYPSAPVARAIAATTPGTLILLDSAADVSLTDVELTGPVSLAIGPEGGVEAAEREQMIAAGFAPASLVGNTLRFETAAIAALAIVRSRLGRHTGTLIDEGKEPPS